MIPRMTQREPGEFLEELAKRLGSTEDAARLYVLDHLRRELTDAEAREYRRLARKAGW